MTSRANILVVDDDETMRLGCAMALEEEGYRVRLAEEGLAGLRAVEEESFDVVLLDLKMPGLGGMEVLKRIKEDNPNTSVIVITGYGTIESAVEAMKRGAYDFLPKPFTPDTLLTIVGRALERRQLALENLCLRMTLQERLGPLPLLGQAPSMVEVSSIIRKVAPTDTTVLIQGETGSGKEVAARAIHSLSLRRERPFVTVDCGSLVESLFESELFGHVKGAFTGATQGKVGKFELANRGTIFLDEIGNIDTVMQAKLLRVLQEREVVKVGGTQRVPLDIRVIVATNLDLLREVEEGRFREDLFYRLSVVPLMLPPLRERVEDIPLLARHFLERYRARAGFAARGFAPEAMDVLQSYSWPGNVRELENVVQRALVIGEGETILAEDIGFCRPVAPVLGEEGHLAAVERQEIVKALARFGGQIARTAEFLGINRKTLREKVRKYHID